MKAILFVVLFSGAARASDLNSLIHNRDLIFKGQLPKVYLNIDQYGVTPSGADLQIYKFDRSYAMSARTENKRLAELVEMFADSEAEVGEISSTSVATLLQDGVLKSATSCETMRTDPKDVAASKPEKPKDVHVMSCWTFTPEVCSLLEFEARSLVGSEEDDGDETSVSDRIAQKVEECSLIGDAIGGSIGQLFSKVDQLSSSKPHKDSVKATQKLFKSRIGKGSTEFTEKAMKLDVGTASKVSEVFGLFAHAVSMCERIQKFRKGEPKDEPGMPTGPKKRKPIAI